MNKMIELSKLPKEAKRFAVESDGKTYLVLVDDMRSFAKEYKTLINRIKSYGFKFIKSGVLF